MLEVIVEKSIKVVFLSFLMPIHLHAHIIHIPTDQPTIQSGIDASTNGDTVLVQPGTYVENINFNGKNIVLGSLFVTTGDTSFISQTVIDGNQNDTVVIFENGEDSTALLTGFTIQNGLASTRHEGGGGIRCLNSHPRLTSLKISHNEVTHYRGKGGGVYCGLANPVLENVLISHNKVYDGGGGIYCEISNPVLSNVVISYNSSHWGAGGMECFFEASPVLKDVRISHNNGIIGGMYIDFNSHPMLTHVLISQNVGVDAGGIAGYGSSPTLSNVTIKGNLGPGIAFGGGDFTPVFDTHNRCNIYLNSPDLETHTDDGLVHAIVVDTFTVMNPTDHEATPIDKFTFDILNAKVSPAHADLYVNPLGDNNNSGLSPAEPLQSITHAMAKIVSDSLQPRTIHLASGVYSPSATDEFFPIDVKSFVTLKGESQDGVILDAERKSNLLILGESGSSIENLTLTGGNTPRSGGAISCGGSRSKLLNLTIRSNESQRAGGGLYVHFGAKPHFTNLTITNNIALKGGGIGLGRGANPSLDHVTISHNSAELGGGIHFQSRSRAIFNDQDRCNIYLNQAVQGKDLYSEYNSEPIAVVVDTFTVKTPTDFEAYPRNSFTFDILNGKLQSEAADLYVSPDGDNSNSGLSAAEPLKTLSYAMSKINADSSQPHTIYLARGMYSPSTNREFFPIYAKNYVSIEGQSQEQVILDAEGKHRVLLISGKTGVGIKNLTLTGGKIPSAQDTDIGRGSGGGVFCGNSNPEFINVTIRDNTANDGGGMAIANNSSPLLKNVTLRNNTATDRGGGLYVYENRSNASAHVELSHVTIAHNTANRGGGICFGWESQAVFSTEDRCNIYLNLAESGRDLWKASGSETSIAVVLDTFTVQTPTGYYAHAVENFAFDILNGKLSQIAADVYVSSDGDNGNSGLSPTEAFRNIWFALPKLIADRVSPRTIHLANGHYSASTTGERFPIDMLSYVSLSGESQAGVILDAEQREDTGVLEFEDDIEIKVDNLTLTGGNAREGGGAFIHNSSPVFEKVTFRNNTAGQGGGITTTENSNPHFNHVSIENNTATDRGPAGGGIEIRWESRPRLTNVLIVGNRAINGDGGGINCNECNPSFANVTIKNNHAADRGGGIHFWAESRPVFHNQNRCSIYDNTARLGRDLSGFSNNLPITVPLDTFTVLHPNEQTVHPIKDYNFDIRYGKYEQIAADLYVNAIGDDANSGLSAFEPLHTISSAFVKILADQANPRTIFLADGLYSPSSNGETFPLLIPSHITLSGASQNEVILDPESDRIDVLHMDQTMGIGAENLTLTGGRRGIWCWDSSPNLSDLMITKNRNGCIISENSRPKLSNVTIKENGPGYRGGGILFYNSTAIFDTEYRCSIFDNEAAEGSDLYSGDSRIISVVVDTFTVLTPTEQHAFPLNKFRIDILHAKSTTGVDESVKQFPTEYALRQNYPNPFNPHTTIRYQIPEAGHVAIEIFNMMGQRIRTLVEEDKVAGQYSVQWDGKDDTGQAVASGMYLYHIEAEGFTQSRKMLLMR
ncbi:hypothetical protein BVY01_00145 [bacterium I07]|nr:hypothetical protein BVY01_00145 [bacterium I07]